MFLCSIYVDVILNIQHFRFTPVQMICPRPQTDLVEARKDGERPPSEVSIEERLIEEVPIDNRDPPIEVSMEVSIEASTHSSSGDLYFFRYLKILQLSVICTVEVSHLLKLVQIFVVVKSYQ